MQDLVAEWSERISESANRREALQLRGGGSKDFYGGRAHGTPLDTARYRGIIDYEPTELVLTARCGTPLAEIETTLAEQAQMLAFEPPHFGATATLGGAVACGFAGPRRAAVGSLRDFVLGVRILDGRGRDLAFGGRVMKNVAGYDVSRLMAGALGTLGLLLDVSLKVLPRPAEERTLRYEMAEPEAILRLNTWAAKPYPISASCYDGTTLSVRLSGTHAGVDAMARQLGGCVVADGADFWQSVREQRHAFFAGAAPLWRLAVKSTAPVLPLPGAQLIEWNGALRWVTTDADASVVIDVARKAGGHAMLFRGRADDAVAFQPLGAGLPALHKRLKQVFDPAGILNPGRLYPEL